MVARTISARSEVLVEHCRRSNGGLYYSTRDEFIECLNDYGDGSPCGSLFVDEPGMPKGFEHTLLTVEWGAGGGALYKHPLKADGAVVERDRQR